MKFTLSDGTIIDLTRIISVSPVRDMGPDPDTISLSRIGFTIHLDQREFLQVTKQYHYADWPVVKKCLEKDRRELINKWDEVMGE